MLMSHDGRRPAKKQNTAAATMEKLPFNCTPCRLARTKCDKTGPSCRRCVRLMIPCTGGHVKPKRGRPLGLSKAPTAKLAIRKKKPKKNLTDRDVLASKFSPSSSVEGSHVVVAPPSGDAYLIKINPSRVYQREIVTVVKESYDHDTLCRALRAHIIYWVWMAQNRQSRVLLAEAINLMTAVHAPFSCIQDTFNAYNVAMNQATQAADAAAVAGLLVCSSSSSS